MKSEFFKEWIKPIIVGLIGAGIAWAFKEFWRNIEMNKHLISFIITFSPIIIGFIVFCFYWIIKDYLKLRYSIYYSKNGGKGREIDLLRNEINDLKKWIGLLKYKNNYSDLKGKIYYYIRGELEKKQSQITIRPIGDQIFQSINGKTLVKKWGVKPYVLLNIVKNRLIDAYTQDEGTDIIANKTEQETEESLAFYTKKNETDEDAVLHLRFKPQDIREFERKIEDVHLTKEVLKKLKWK